MLAMMIGFDAFGSILVIFFFFDQVERADGWTSFCSSFSYVVSFKLEELTVLGPV